MYHDTASFLFHEQIAAFPEQLAAFLATHLQPRAVVKSKAESTMPIHIR
jgi:hypothetical protein